MASILDRDAPLYGSSTTITTVTGSETTSQYVIAAISLILILAFCCWIMYNMSADPPTTQAYFQCPAGQCATNIYNGEKRCPLDPTIRVTYDAAFETCNSKFTCESKLTPYALLSNGATSELGICETNTVCRCLSRPQCPIETMVIFDMIQGSTYLQDNNTSRAIFAQIPLGSQGDIGSPFTFDSTSSQFCAIKANHLNRVTPGSCSFANPNQITVTEMRTCLQRNPCLVGVMAFHPTDINSFRLSASNTDAIYSVPVTCVPGYRPPNGGSVCGGLTVPVWDPTKGQVVCYNVGS